jgi:hypothetical protein
MRLQAVDVPLYSGNGNRQQSNGCVVGSAGFIARRRIFSRFSDNVGDGKVMKKTSLARLLNQ